MEKGIIQKYSTKSNAYRNQGSGMAALFGETPEKLKNTSADGFIKTKGAGISSVAGKKTDETTKELLSLLNGDYSPAPAAKDRYEKNGGVADAAGGEIYDWVKDVKDFFDKPGSFSTPNIRDKTMRGEKILNKPEYDEAYYNSDNKMAFVPRVREQQKFDESFMETYNEAEHFLDNENHENVIDNVVAASFNRFHSTPGRLVTNTFKLTADVIEKFNILPYDAESTKDFVDTLRCIKVIDDLMERAEQMRKNGQQPESIYKLRKTADMALYIMQFYGRTAKATADLLRSFEYSDDIYKKSELQYSHAEEDGKFISGLAVNTGKAVTDLASAHLWGWVFEAPPQVLSTIYAATEKYNCLRENGKEVTESLVKSGLYGGASYLSGKMFDFIDNDTAKTSAKHILGPLAEYIVPNAVGNTSDFGDEITLEGTASMLFIGCATELLYALLNIAKTIL